MKQTKQSLALYCMLVTMVSSSTAQVQFEVSSYPSGGAGQHWQAVVGDFNGDGVPDVAVTNFRSLVFRSSSVSILFGNGDGSFTLDAEYAVPDGAFDLVAGDFNRDGVLDLAVLSWESTGSTSSAAVLLGNPDGTFQPATVYPLGSVAAYGIAMADFSVRGILDLAVLASVPSDVFHDQFLLLYGNGDGTFNPPVSVSGVFPSQFESHLAAADVNGDGFPDLLTPMEVHLGNGDGTLGPAIPLPSGGGDDYNLSVLAIGDFDRDGSPDIAVRRYHGCHCALPRTVSVLLGNGDGTFRQAGDYSLTNDPSSGPGALEYGTTADFNEDGILDLAISSQPYTGGPHVVSVLLGNGDGSFQPGQETMIPDRGASIATGDLKGDGRTDMVIPSIESNNIYVLINQTPRRITSLVLPLSSGFFFDWQATAKYAANEHQQLASKERD